MAPIDDNRRDWCAILGGLLYLRWIIALAVIFLSSVMAVARDLAVIVNKESTVQSLGPAEAVKICKGQTSHWPDGKAITLIMRDPGAAEMKVALEKIYGMSKEEVTALIAGANHGRTNHPAIEIAESDEALVKRVESTPGAVGLVDVYSITSGVNVVKIGGKLPLEPGYPWHGN
jgi:ABC-type phosphate transport system substrate-binding protein